MQAPSNLVLVRIKNFMGISNVEFKPDQINQVVGENNQGKTTILKALEFVFKGSTNGQLVKHGQDEAEVFIELPDGTSIRRRLTHEGKQSVIVRDGADFKKDAPQSYLDTLVDKSGFNPLSVLDADKRHESILSAIPLVVTPEMLANRIGIDVKDLPKLTFKTKDGNDVHGLLVIDEAYRYHDKRRTEVNRDALKAEEKFKAFESEFKPIAPPQTDKTEINLMRETISSRRARADAEIKTIQAVETDNATTQATIDRYTAEIEKIGKNQEAFEKENSQAILDKEAQIEKLKKEIELLNADFEAKNTLAKQRTDDGLRFIEETKKNFKPVPSKEKHEKELSELREQSAILDTADAEWKTYETVEASRRFLEKLKSEWDDAQAYAEMIEARAKLLQKQFKIELMSTVEMPIEGLEYVDEVFMVNGVPIDQLNSATQMKLGINIARKKAKKSKIILADGIERLDDKVRTEFYKEIEDDGYTYFFSNVGEGDPNYRRIVMANGLVVQ